MTPDYVSDDGRVTLYCADCLDVLPTLEAGSVDCVLTDPPYNERTHKGAITHKHNGVKTNEINFDPLTDPAWLVKQSLRICNRWCLSFCSFEEMTHFRDEAYKTESWVRAGVWDRVNPPPQFTGDRPSQAADGIAIWHGQDRKRWNGGGKQGIWRHSVEFNHKEHPTQKPLRLMCELVAQFTDIDGIIIDPFMGGGTTGVAAVKLGRRFIGIEISHEYFAIALRRIQQAEAQPALLQV